jgi:hypothetical protein
VRCIALLCIAIVGFALHFIAFASLCIAVFCSALLRFVLFCIARFCFAVPLLLCYALLCFARSRNREGALGGASDPPWGNLLHRPFRDHTTTELKTDLGGEMKTLLPTQKRIAKSK